MSGQFMESAAEIRDLLTRLGLTQRAAAFELEVHHRDVRYWCAGRHKPPRAIMLALERLVEMQGFSGQPISHTDWCAWTQTRGRGQCTCGGRI